MKKQIRNCFLVIIFLGSEYARAQIIVTRNDFAHINDISVSAYDTVFAGITPGNAGASQTWDLSALQNHYVDTNYFMSPLSTPYPGFTSANIAAYNSLDSTYTFIDANAGALNIVGYVIPNPFTGSPAVLSFSPPVTQITFPSTLLTTFNVSNDTAKSTFYY